MVHLGRNLHIVLTAFLLYDTFYLDADVRVVNAGCAVNVVLAVEPVHLDVLIVVAIVVEGVHDTVGIDADVSVFGQLPFQGYLRGYMAKARIVQQAPQVHTLCVDVAVQPALFVYLQVDDDVSCIRVQQVMRGDVLQSPSCGGAFQHDTAYAVDNRGQFCLPAFQVFRDEVDGLG